MSPEQARGAKTIDHRTDIYALGCVLLELATGQPPFVRKGPAQVIVAHLHETAPRASSLEPSVPPELDALIAEMLAKDPDKRPQAMTAVLARLAEPPAAAPGASRRSSCPAGARAARGRSSRPPLPSRRRSPRPSVRAPAPTAPAPAAQARAGSAAARRRRARASPAATRRRSHAPAARRSATPPRRWSRRRRSSRRPNGRRGSWSARRRSSSSEASASRSPLRESRRGAGQRRQRAGGRAGSRRANRSGRARRGVARQPYRDHLAAGRAPRSGSATRRRPEVARRSRSSSPPGASTRVVLRAAGHESLSLALDAKDTSTRHVVLPVAAPAPPPRRPLTGITPRAPAASRRSRTRVG